MLSEQSLDDIINKSAGTASALEPETLEELSEATGIPLDDIKKQHDEAYYAALKRYGIDTTGPVRV